MNDSPGDSNPGPASPPDRSDPFTTADLPDDFKDAASLGPDQLRKVAQKYWRVTGDSSTPLTSRQKRSLWVLPVVIAGAAWETYVTKMLWNWFVPGTVRGARPIGNAQAIGLGLVVSTLKPSPMRVNRPRRAKKAAVLDDPEAILRFVAARTFSVTSLFVIGAIAKRFVR